MKRAKTDPKEACPAAGAEAREVRVDALMLRDRIITHDRAAEEFFFVEMLPKMAALADSYNRTFGLNILAEDVANATYLSCWEDDWAKLRAFKGKTLRLMHGSQRLHRRLHISFLLRNDTSIVSEIPRQATIASLLEALKIRLSVKLLSIWCSFLNNTKLSKCTM